MTFLITIIGSCIATLICAEFSAWAPRIAKSIASLAARHCPEDLRERMLEEWLAHVEQTPGRSSKVVVAIGFWVAAGSMASERKSATAAKRVHKFVGVACGATMLFLFAPTLAFFGMLICLESPGPAMFRQLQVRKDGSTFYLYKFRTMQLGHPGVTRIGTFLRATRLDRLPALINVLKGEMDPASWSRFRVH